MNEVSKAVSNIFTNRKQFIVIGLTGRTGSGCSTAAKLLTKSFETISRPIELEGRSDVNPNEKRKYKILYEYAKNNWVCFKMISMRSIISSFIVETSFEDFVEFIGKIYKEQYKKDDSDLQSQMENIRSNYQKLYESHKNCSLENLKKQSRKNSKQQIKEIDKEKKKEVVDFYQNQLNSFTKELEKTLDNLSDKFSITCYQQIGMNIRSSGKITDNTFSDVNNIFKLADRTNKLIKLLRAIEGKKSNLCVVIDAIRNPFEASFFKDRYSAFYLLAINTSDENRLRRLQDLNFTKEQIKKIDKQEYPEKLTGNKKFISQDIQKCIEWADIHINNPQMSSRKNLKEQLIWYIGLILHPGLVNPTAMERGMQVAYSAKLNSGCISRQVGAVVTDKFYSIKAVGWNSTPEGQVPCVLRSVENLINGENTRTFSKYENEDEEFRKHFKSTYKMFDHEQTLENERKQVLNVLKGRNVSFCFKDIKNSLDGEKNQVHTRSLHAEENAFLQIAKYGGEGIKGGFLFTTASPCELCAKKAYQLGIRKIIYIDPYPGITNEHILESGTKNPQLELFTGVIGSSYHKLYQQIFAYKDELNMLLGI